MKSIVIGMLLCLGAGAIGQAQVAGIEYVQYHGQRRAEERREERRIERNVERHEAREAWRPHPGWQPGWHWNRGYRPRWYGPRIILPGFYWIDVPVGYWQCTAFNENQQVFTRVGPDVDQAAWGALSACGGSNYQAFGCYIPNNYCQLRR